MTQIIYPDPHCTVGRIGESLRKRAAAHERVARSFRQAAKQLAHSVKLLGEADADAYARVNANFLRHKLIEIWDEKDRLETENAALLAQVLGDDPIAATVAVAAE